jgi:4-hydroxyphenylpyruvate dioxygenase
VKRHQLAVNSVSTRRAGLAECLAGYEAAGFANVEFMLSHVRDYLAEGHAPADVRRLLADHGLRCIGGFEGIVECFSSGRRRRENRRRLLDNARLLAELGAGLLVTGTDGPRPGGEVADPLAEIAAGFAEAADDLKETGICLCLEFNWSPMVKSLRTAADVARRTGRQNVGVLFDPAHYHCTPTKFDQLTRENVAAIRHVHVDDMRDKPGELSDCNADRVLPGQGCLDLKSP